MAGYCAQTWGFFYAPPTVGDRLWRPADGATDSEYPPSGIGVGTGAHSSARHSVSANKRRDFFHPRDWRPDRPPQAAAAPNRALPPIARQRVGWDVRNGFLRPDRPSP